jgi:sialate O-acetylesterase
MTVSFKYTDGGLTARELPEYYWLIRNRNQKAKLVRNSPASQLEGFAVCGKDGKWVWADAKISGNKVVVSAPAVKEPTAVRYAWQNNPTCNLYTGAGLPAAPFQLKVK